MAAEHVVVSGQLAAMCLLGRFAGGEPTLWPSCLICLAVAQG